MKKPKKVKKIWKTLPMVKINLTSLLNSKSSVRSSRTMKMKVKIRLLKPDRQTS